MRVKIENVNKNRKEEIKKENQNKIKKIAN